ncbi:hypothetical protein [Kocuria arenosa]|uniref:hypothetical protein n=1 Tax=Kocuria arenosa TaxID=3071446 RepID=UPI0034D7BB68
MSAASMPTVTGVVAVTAAVAWGLAHRVRRWRAVVRLRRVQAYRAGLRAELELSDERICIGCAARPTWNAQKLTDMEGVFAQLDGVLERRRLDEGAEVGRLVPRWVHRWHEPCTGRPWPRWPPSPDPKLATVVVCALGEGWIHRAYGN